MGPTRKLGNAKGPRHAAFGARRRALKHRRTSAAVRARPGNAAAVDRGCSACTASRNIKARNNICGHSGSGLQRSIKPSSASPHDNASTTTTPAAHDAGRQYGVMSVIPGAAVPAKSTVP